MTFNEHDWVIHSKTGNRGQVLEIADDIAYIELDNGVEMDFLISELMLEEDYKSPEEERQEEIESADAVTLKVAEMILPEVRNMWVALAMIQADKAAVAVRLLGGSASPWEEMNAFHKMNFICVSTHTKFIDWVHAYNENNMVEFQKDIMTALNKRVGLE